MDRIGIVGVSLHATDVTGLAEIRRPPAEHEGAFLRDVADVLGASELVFIATCNRVEVVYAREEGPPPEEHDVPLLARHLAPVIVPREGDATGDDASPGTSGDGATAAGATADEIAARIAERLIQRTGVGAVRHVFRVASSLDSLVVGEDQILAQVRSAFEHAESHGLVGPLLRPLFVHALQVGKRVRTETDLARHPISVVNLAVTTLCERAAEGPAPRVAVVGAGEMGSLLARALTAVGMSPAVIANRSVERARLLAADCGAKAASLDAFLGGLHPVDAIVTATSAPGLVLSRDDLLRLARLTPSGQPLLAIDLAVPRDLPLVDEASCRVVDLDALRAVADQNRALRAEAAAAAERLVESKVDVYTRHHREAAASPVVSEVRASAEEILGKELDGLLNVRMTHLSERDRRTLERWAHTTFGRLMHLPITALKQLASELASLRGHDTDEPAGDGRAAAHDGESLDDASRDGRRPREQRR